MFCTARNIFSFSSFHSSSIGVRKYSLSTMASGGPEPQLVDLSSLPIQALGQMQQQVDQVRRRTAQCFGSRSISENNQL